MRLRTVETSCSAFAAFCSVFPCKKIAAIYRDYFSNTLAIMEVTVQKLYKHQFSEFFHHFWKISKDFQVLTCFLSKRAKLIWVCSVNLPHKQFTQLLFPNCFLDNTKFSAYFGDDFITHPANSSLKNFAEIYYMSIIC